MGRLEMDLSLQNTEELIRTEVTAGLEDLSTEEILAWALDKFSPRIALACSFQAEESVLIDLMHRMRGSDFRIFTLDTGRLNQETYDCMDAIRARYRVGVEVYFPDAIKVQEMVRGHFTTPSNCANSAAASAKSSRSTAR